MSDTADKVREIIADELGVELEKVSNDASFVEDLGADSLDTVELVMRFEEEFEVEIPDKTQKKCRRSATRSSISASNRTDLLGRSGDPG